MSTPQPDGRKNLKRPRGLLASRKNVGASAELGPSTKRSRANDSQPEIDQKTLNAQDWSDLKELFENALDLSYGENPAAALPLIRGVLHECARLVSVHKDPTMIYSPLGDSGPTSSVEPASAFYTIYASAWFLMSAFARADASDLTQDEPAEPITYVLSALAACEEGQKALDARKQGRAWDLEVVWGRALVGAARSRIDLDEDEDEDVTGAQFSNGTPPTLGTPQLADPDHHVSLQRGTDRLLYALDNRPDTSLEGGDDAEKLTRDGRFAHSLIDAARNVLAVAECLPQDPEDVGDSTRIMKHEHLLNARVLFARIVGMPNIATNVLAQAVFGEAQAGLAVGAAIAEILEDADENEGGGSLRKKAVDSLKTAIEKLDYLREQSSNANNKAPVDEEDLKPLLQEALVTVATLLPEGPEQEAMYARYREEGGTLDDGDEEDGDEEDGDGEDERKSD
ncbi:hypothetical protein FRC10_006764 [Ceratobasidium sp. 414]|nr:hypothetical protein FRC10_006764 [Ceratobasidium sp. 414]